MDYTHSRGIPVSRIVLNEIHRDQKKMVEQLFEWSSLNSHSENLPGLTHMASILKKDFSILEAHVEEIHLPPRTQVDAKGNVVELPSGKALRFRKHAEAPFKVFLGGHYDTVYPIDGAFQKVEKIGPNKLQGPGVADMKGGLVVMLKALETLEKSPFAGKIGWEVLLNPDEEIGSGASYPLFVEGAHNNTVGLIFEPSFPDGSIVSARKGSANFAVVTRGKAAHAGRDFFSGFNAITAMAQFIGDAEKITSKEKGITLNVGHIQGGTGSNVVPDLAICHLNSRMNSSEEMRQIETQLKTIAAAVAYREGISIDILPLTTRDPKPFGTKEKKLFERLHSVATTMGIDLKWKPSGGVCDGNILAGAGMPAIDTLGVVGGLIHTPEEYMEIDSLSQRAELTARLLISFAEEGYHE